MTILAFQLPFNKQFVLSFYKKHLILNSNWYIVDFNIPSYFLTVIYEICSCIVTLIFGTKHCGNKFSDAGINEWIFIDLSKSWNGKKNPCSCSLQCEFSKLHDTNMCDLLSSVLWQSQFRPKRYFVKYWQPKLKLYFTHLKCVIMCGCRNWHACLTSLLLGRRASKLLRIFINISDLRESPDDYSID